MKVRRTMKQSGNTVDRKLPKKKRSVVAAKIRHVPRTPGQRARQGAKPPMGNTSISKGATRSQAREAGKAMGTFLGKAIGNAERLINKTAKTAKDFLG